MKTGSLILAGVVGFLLALLLVWRAMPPMMINVQQSKQSFDETVAAVEQAVAGQPGWKVSHVFDIQANILAGGHPDMTRVKIVTLCNPHYAHRILSDDADKRVATMMPLGIGIYETSDGSVHVSDMNIGIMGRMFGGTIAEVMGEASRDISAMIDSVADGT